MTAIQVQTLTGILSDSKTSLTLGNFRHPRFVLNVHVEVLEAFDSDGSDQIKVGHKDDDDAYVTNLDVSTTGKKSVTLGAGINYDATPRTVIAKYTAGGSAPTQGAVLVIVEYIPSPEQP